MLHGVLTSLVPIDKPQEDPNIRGDAFKTLIVARLSYDATEQDLESEFGRFGPIERVRFVIDILLLSSDWCLLADPHCYRHTSR
jgi:RNA recognition motif-containing protein